MAGRHAGEIQGRTGMWFLATDKFVHSDDLAVHLRFLQDLLYPTPGDDMRLMKLRDVLGRTHSQTRITCFWYGDPGETPPVVPPGFLSAVAPLAPEVEMEFETV